MPFSSLFSQVVPLTVLRCPSLFPVSSVSSHTSFAWEDFKTQLERKWQERKERNRAKLFVAYCIPGLKSIQKEDPPHLHPLGGSTQLENLHFRPQRWEEIGVIIWPYMLTSCINYWHKSTIVWTLPKISYKSGRVHTDTKFESFTFAFSDPYLLLNISPLSLTSV